MSGDRYERDLVNALDETDEWVTMRCPSSGSATTRDLPDVIALRPVKAIDTDAVDLFGPPGEYVAHVLSRVLAIEVKTTSRTTAYADAEEVEALEAFAHRAGGRPLLAAKFKRPGKRTPYYLVDPSDCRITDGGNYGVPEADADERAAFVVWAATDTKDAAVEARP